MVYIDPDRTTNVLLTGSTRGIGAAVMATLRDRPKVRVIGHGRADGPETIGADLSQPRAAEALWAEAERRLGHVDILINNAGVFEANDTFDAHDQWLAGWERTMRINLTAAAELCRLAVARWVARESYEARIVNVASRAAHRGDSPQHWHYAASKAGMVAMTKTIARAHARDGIYAFAVCPGFTMTAMAEDYLASRGGDRLLADIPLGRVAGVEEVANVVRYLALDAPASMTGAVLDINGASYVR
jgi:NAD(P)-dependent dehydrogenase (short-subunit alcohol dehydrogenase family)